MAVSIKNKIRSGTIFLFALLVLLGGVSIYFLLKIRADSKNILTDNYESIDYCNRMQRQLDTLSIRDGMSLTTFNSLLLHQEDNITEKGEQPETQALRTKFNLLVKGDSSSQNLFELRQHLQNILSLNMQAIQRKNQQADNSSETATTVITVISALTFIIGLTFSFNFPGVVTTPIGKLTETVKQISKKNYAYRIHLDTKDEFGQLADAFNSMTERLEDFENSNLNKLIFEKARAEAVINSLKDASIGIDKNDTILFANKQALTLLGLESGDMVGLPVETISKRNDLFRFLIENNSTAPFKIVIEEKENYYLKEMVEVAQQDSFSKVIVLKNITSFKELDVAKTNFIATVSHELKTPLASTDFSLKLLEDERIGNLVPEQKELVQQLKNDNLRMLKILSELLNMSQVDAGKIQLNIAPANLSEIIQASLQAVSSSIKEKHINIEQKGDTITNMPLDADKISWVINNFLTNAISFSPPDGIITILTKQTDKIISVSVQDQGPGIDEMYFNRIFERFFQIPGRSQKSGSGIGLAICKDLITAMGGNIWVSSKLGEGSVFGFDLQK